MTDIAKGTLRDQYIKLIKGLTTQFPPGATFVLDGVSYARDELVAVFQAVVDAVPQTDKARASYNAAVRAEREAKKKAGPVKYRLRDYFQLMYGRNGVKFAPFGLAPRKERKKPTLKVQAEAVAKSTATREVRGTMGKKQRKKIKAAPPAPAQPLEEKAAGKKKPTG